MLKQLNLEFFVVRYMDGVFTNDSLKDLIKKLQIEPLELIRKKESIWKEQYEKQNLSDEELIQIMVNNPKLIRRPIIEIGESAVIGEREEDVLVFLKKNS